MSEESETVTVAKSDLIILQRAHALLDKLYTHGEKGLEFQRMLKAVIPEARLPQLERIETLTKPYDEKFSKLEKEMKEDKESRAKEKQEAKDKEEESSLRKTLDQVKKDYGFTDEGMQKVIARMQDKKNPDVEAAAAYVARSEPKAKPTASSSYTPSSLNLYGANEKDEKWAELNKNPMGFFDKEVNKVLDEFSEFGQEKPAA